MKFLQLKAAFEKASGIPSPPEPVFPVVEPAPLQASPKPLQAIVLSDGISRTPVNKQTALLVAKPPWWAYPPIQYGTNNARPENVATALCPKQKTKPDHRQCKKVEPCYAHGKTEKNRPKTTPKRPGKSQQASKQDILAMLRRQEEEERKRLADILYPDMDYWITCFDLCVH